MFFVIFWTALVRYTWLSNSSLFFSDNQYFRMFLVSMADIIGSCERLPNDAVRAVAVAKRREYISQLGWWHSHILWKNKSHVPNHQPMENWSWLSWFPMITWIVWGRTLPGFGGKTAPEMKRSGKWNDQQRKWGDCQQKHTKTRFKSMGKIKTGTRWDTSN